VFARVGFEQSEGAVRLVSVVQRSGLSKPDTQFGEAIYRFCVYFHELIARSRFEYISKGSCIRLGRTRVVTRATW